MNALILGVGAVIIMYDFTTICSHNYQEVRMGPVLIK
jgi:hypothetical protein